jgi:FkbM family methyltransferase
LISIFKWLASLLPVSLQQRLKRRHYARQIRRNQFVSDEQEFQQLAHWVEPGNWILDVGANIGQYSARFSELVGPIGRVISFEPVPRTFELLAANMALLPTQNVTLINAAASDSFGTGGMEIPKFDTGLDNYYMASLQPSASDISVLLLPIDNLQIPERIALAKIDVEGHELSALRGMENIVRRDTPTLIVEGYVDEVATYLAELGYGFETFEGSSNRVYRYAD